jgi:nicotinamide-nucleotide adenylyltransferase
MKTGFYTGRFQPFHKGHLSAVKQALRDVDFLYICIGSAQYHDTKANPFTLEERIEMIKLSLEDSQISDKRYQILPLPDIHNNDKWPAYAIGKIGKPDIIFVGDDGLVKELFEKHTDIPVKIVKKEIDIRATDIREAMEKNNDWKKHLSESAGDYLEKIGAVARVKKISNPL